MWRFQRTTKYGLHQQEIVPKNNSQFAVRDNYPRMDNSLLVIYATNEIIPKTERAITRLVQYAEMNSSHYAEKLILMTFRCGYMYGESGIN